MADVLRSLAALSWPTLLAVVIFYYRKEIKDIFPRLKKAGVNGLEFAEQKLSQSKAKSESLSEVTEAQAKSEAPYVPVFQSPAIKNVENDIKENLRSLNLSDTQKIDLLINELAMTRISRHFYKIYLYIFGSQITGLRHLNTREKISITDAKDYFDSVKGNYPDIYSNFGFDDWTGYLLSQYLITSDGINLKITPIGREFLMFMIDNRLPDDKIG